MYFGLSQIPHRQDRFDAPPYEAPCAGPDLFDGLAAFFRRFLRSLFR